MYGELRELKPKSRLEKQENWRNSFDTTILLRRLYKQSLDESEMSDKAITAARILLAKSVPDLKAIDHSGEVGGVTSIHLHI